MVNQDLWNKFKEGKIVINCKTEDEAKIFLKYCKDNNMTWSSGDDLEEITNWKNCQDSMCYDCWGNEITYESAEFFETEYDDVEVVTYELLFIETEAPQKTEIPKETEQPKTYKGSEILAMIEDGILKDDDVIIDKEKDEWYVCDFKSDDNEKEVSCFILFEYAPFTIKQKPVDFMTAYNSHKKVKPEHGEYIYSDMKDYLEVIRNSNQDTADKLMNGKWYIE